MPSAPSEVYFAQLTDIHVGNNNLNGEAARRHVRWALAEIASLEPQPRCILATADLVCSGRRDELEQYVELTRDTAVPIAAVPANHDLWGEDDTAVWQELIGPTRHTIDLGGLRLLMFQEMKRRGNGWHAHVSEDDARWLDKQLTERPDAHAAVAFHAPILEQAGDYHDNWAGSNAREFLEQMKRREVLALITGHWHRVNEWQIGGVRLINTGALVGWQWTGIPPYYSFPVRPGYRLFHYDAGELRSFWRELASQESRPDVQINVVTIGPAHTGGPRPQVRTVTVFTSVRIRVHTCAPSAAVESVEWSVCNGQWHSMERAFDGLWQEWEAQLDPRDFRAGEQVLAVRATLDGRPRAYDAVPIELAEAPSPPLAPAQAGRETVFELFYTPQ